MTSQCCYFYFKTNYEVSSPISLKTNNKKPTYVIVHLHICVFSTWKQTYIINIYGRRSGKTGLNDKTSIFIFRHFQLTIYFMI